MHILRLSCDDKPGIVAAVATTLSNNQCNIEESAQFNDHLSGQFYMRVVFTALQDGCIESFAERFQEIAGEYVMKLANLRYLTALKDNDYGLTT